MAIVGLLLSIYVCFELKKPADPNTETQLVELFDQHYNHEYLHKIFGENIKYYTIHQVVKYLKEVIWQSFFQFSIAISKLVDVDPQANIDKALGKISSKNLKAMHILEMMSPKRTEDVRRKELSEKIMKVRDEREEQAKAIEEKPKETEATEAIEDGENNIKEPVEETPLEDIPEK